MSAKLARASSPVPHDRGRVALALERHLDTARDGGLVLDDHDGAGHDGRL